MLEKVLYAAGGAIVGAGSVLLSQVIFAKPARKPGGKKSNKKRTSGK